jgi:hypothetical protein
VQGSALVSKLQHVVQLLDGLVTRSLEPFRSSISSNTSSHEHLEYHHTSSAIRNMRRVSGLSSISMSSTIARLSLLACFIHAATTQTLSLSFKSCCVYRAREHWTTLNMLPWEACAADSSPDKPNPSVNVPRSWCQTNCTRFTPSTFSQWSDLLTTFVAPALGLLILCPIGSPESFDDEEVYDGDNEEDDQTPLQGVREAHESGRDEHMAKTASVTALPSNRRDGDDFHLQHHHMSKRAAKKKVDWNQVAYSAREYVSLLGDPASAIAGSFHQLLWDLQLVRALSAVKEYSPVREVHEDALRLALLGGQTMVYGSDPTTTSKARAPVDGYELSTLLAPESPEPEDQSLGGLMSEAPTPAPSRHGSRDRTSFYQNPTDDGSTIELLAIRTLGSLSEGMPGGPLPQQGSKSKIRSKLDYTIRLLLTAKVDFTNGVVVPMILTYGGCAAGFYGAYKAIGDRDKAFSLSFGVSYAWLLVLSVVSNCCAITVNSSLLETSLALLLRPPQSQSPGGSRPGSPFSCAPYTVRVVPFRKRIKSTAWWSHWIDHVMAENDAQTSKGGFVLPAFLSHAKSHRFQLTAGSYAGRFILMQLLGWLCVMVFVACGILIAYRTPTVGFGCRSVTLLLYVAGSFVNALLHWLRVISDQRGSRLTPVLNSGYRMLTLLNAVFLVGGTTAQVSGLFQSCRCSALFQGRDALVELNILTQQDVSAAKEYWLPVGYIAFVIALLVSSGTVVVREFIMLRMAARFIHAPD